MEESLNAGRVVPLCGFGFGFVGFCLFYFNIAISYWKINFETAENLSVCIRFVT